VEVIHIPGVTIISFGDHTTKDSGSDTRFVKSKTKIDLGRLHDVHLLYKRVVHFEQSAKSASNELKTLIKKDPAFRSALCSSPIPVTNASQYSSTGSSSHRLWAYHLPNGLQRLRAGPSRCRRLLWGDFVAAPLGC
jgi:hypothetical protein